MPLTGNPHSFTVPFVGSIRLCGSRLVGHGGLICPLPSMPHCQPFDMATVALRATSSFGTIICVHSGIMHVHQSSHAAANCCLVTISSDSTRGQNTLECECNGLLIAPLRLMSGYRVCRPSALASDLPDDFPRKVIFTTLNHLMASACRIGQS
jgi:hypothetical protein